MKSLSSAFLLVVANVAMAQTTSPQVVNAPESAPAIPILQINAGRVTAHTSPTFYGLMTEEINFSYEGGLYGELIRNRTFKANPTNVIYWSAVGDAAIESEGHAIVLQANQLDDTNSIQEPKKIVPVEENASGFGADFTHEFPPYSITVLELKPK
jgi:hypothetical protein